MEQNSLRPLFVPLKGEYYEQFEQQLAYSDVKYDDIPSSVKKEEFRKYGKQWTEKHCFKGRRVVLSYGYGKQRRLLGEVVHFRTTHQFSPSYIALYGKTTEPMAAIGIKVLKKLNENG